MSFGADKRKQTEQCWNEDLFDKQTGAEDWPDILLDLGKDDSLQERHCAACMRTGAPLVGCNASNRYASYCTVCSAHRQGARYKGLYICGMCFKDSQTIGGADSFEQNQSR